MASKRTTSWSEASLPKTLVATRSNSITSERFSLLLLEFGEIYFEDFSVIFYPAATTEAESIERKQKGRLKLCSQSVLFDPIDFTYPITKVAFRDCINIQKYECRPDSRFPDNTFIINATQVTEMMVRNIIAPFRFIKEKRGLIFSLTYGDTDAVLSQILTMEHAVRLPRADQQAVIENVVVTRQSQVSFDTTWLESLYEEQVLEIYGEHVTPLVSNPGRIMLTSSRIYFQPFNNVEVDPVIKIDLSSLKHVMKRRYMLRHVGLELFTGNGATLFLVLSSTSNRNTLYEKLINLPEVRLKDLELVELTQKWQSGELSNYDYLMSLNYLSDRSFIDIMQYPVMPWIVADYTSTTLDLTNPKTFRDLSKPIGALTKERLAFYKERMAGMSGRPFLYGTHYSAPGYILYYLVRTAPEYLLCLQNGRFDQPNRLFHSVAQTWDNVLTDHADVKELIPEFYQPPGDFLSNFMALDLGVRSDGARVNDVILPPWAKDANDFTVQCLAALESDYVSQRLHNWIDLIFGHKQQGIEAQKADNVFHYLTYESSSNLDHMIDSEMRAAIELQIKEFGQTPKQLFAAPHPKRLVNTSTAIPIQPSSPSHSSISSEPPLTPGGSELPNDWVFVQSKDTTNSPTNSLNQTTPSTDGLLKLKTMQKSHKDAISSVGLSSDGKTAFSVSLDKSLKVHQVHDWQLLRSSAISSLPLSSIYILPDSKTVIIGSWDNSLYLYSVEYASVVNSSIAHDSSVTSVAWCNGILVTGSWDSTVKVWNLPYKASGKTIPPDYITEFDHDNEVSCVAIDQSCKLIVSGVADGYISVWSIQDEAKIFEIRAHDRDVLDVKFSPDGSKICSTGKDNQIKLISVAEGRELVSAKGPEHYHCISWFGDRILCGGSMGTLFILDGTTLATVNKMKSHTDAITCIDSAQPHQLVVTGSKDRCIGVWSVT